MRPTLLQIEGFSAFRHAVEIDFEGIDVAALVGPTGSGKSSIIDAITFALYGSVARYDDRGAVAPVINQLSTEAKVRLDFTVGNARYTVVRVVRRTKSGATTKEARLESAGQVLAGDARSVDKAVNELLGLDFERFNKTVVLPQGRFATFLHDKPSDRQQLLRELLGLGVYERMGREARQIAAVSGNQLAVLEPQLDADADLSDQAMAELDDRAAMTVELDRQMPDHVAAITTSTLAATTAEAHIGRLDGNLANLADVHVPKELALLAATHADAHHAARTMESALSTIRQQRDSLAATMSEIRTVEACDRLIADYQRLQASGKRLDDLAESHATIVGQHALAMRAADELRDNIEQLRTTLTTARDDRDALSRQLALRPQRAVIESLINANEQRAATQRQFEATISAGGQAATAAEQATSRHNELDAQYQHLRDLGPATSLIAHLRRGEPCPVCAQVVTEVPVADDSAMAERIDGARAEVAHAAHEMRSALETRDRLEAQRLVLEQRLVELQHELSTAGVDVAQAAIILVEIAAFGEQVDRAHQQVARCERELTAIEQSARSRQTMATENSTTRDLASSEAAIAAARASRDELAVALADAPALPEVHAQRAVAMEHQRQLQSLISEERALLGQLEEARQAIGAAENALSRARREYMSQRDRLAGLDPALPRDDLAADWAELAAWAQVTTVEMREQRAGWVTQANEHRAVANHLTAEVTLACRDVLAELNAPHNGWTVELLRDAVARATQRITSEVAHRRERKRAIEQLCAQVAALRDRREVYQHLGNLLRSDGFEKWLLSEILIDLVGRATERLLELSGGQFSLVAADGSFKICDHRNADEVRDARTLSGGETFLASLALALALADASTDLAAHGSASLESIFLDEGFGTLDPDALDIVAGTIEELGAAGRMVTIVTHIRELAERMPVRFDVSKGPQTSTVRRVEV